MSRLLRIHAASPTTLLFSSNRYTVSFPFHMFESNRVPSSSHSQFPPPLERYIPSYFSFNHFFVNDYGGASAAKESGRSKHNPRCNIRGIYEISVALLGFSRALHASTRFERRLSVVKNDALLFLRRSALFFYRFPPKSPAAPPCLNYLYLLSGSTFASFYPFRLRSFFCFTSSK